MLEIGHQAGTHRDAFLWEYLVVEAHHFTSVQHKPYAPDFVDWFHSLGEFEGNYLTLCCNTCGAINKVCTGIISTNAHHIE
jgi:hypothetical protein